MGRQTLPPDGDLFTVTSHRSKSRCCEVIALAGELDMATAPHLEAVLDRMMVIPKHIIVDLSQLNFIDGTGLHLLVRASNLVDGRIWLKGASRHLSKLIELLGLSELFCLEQDPVHAHRAIGGVEPGTCLNGSEHQNAANSLTTA